MYVAAFPEDSAERCVVGDVHELVPAEIPGATLATASFPCTDVSLAGYRKGLEGTQSSAFWGFARLLENMNGRRPSIVMIENVPGLVTSHKGRDLRAIALCLNRLGYSCDAFIVDAVNFVPQSRARLFIIGVMDVSCSWDVSAALADRDQRLRFNQLTEFMIANKDVRWSILNIPAPPRSSVQLIDVLEDLPPDSHRWWSTARTEYLVNQMSNRHREVAERLTRDDGLHYATVYRRVRDGVSRAELRVDNIAGCLRTPRGGSSRQILFVAGKGTRRARFMTPREYARLQGVPDSFPITVPDNQALFGFGDAVCIPVISWVAENCLNPLLAYQNKEAFAVGTR
jgi:DNA (cytosine-5)-methyltransferase 1